MVYPNQGYDLLSKYALAQFPHNVNVSLSRLTLGIRFLGHVGRKVGRLLGHRVAVCHSYVTDAVTEAQRGARGPHKDTHRTATRLCPLSYCTHTYSSVSRCEQSVVPGVEVSTAKTDTDPPLTEF